MFISVKRALIDYSKQVQERYNLVKQYLGVSSTDYKGFEMRSCLPC